MNYARHLLLLCALGLTAVSTAGCGAPILTEDSAAVSLSEASLADVLRIESRSDGLFDVYCKDGRVQLGITAEQVGKGDVCNPVLPPSPFDPSTCSGPRITITEAVSHFPTAASRVKIGSFFWSKRSRQCNKVTGCNGWSAPSIDTAVRDYYFYTTSGSVASYFEYTDGRWHSDCGTVTTTTRCGSYPAQLTNHCLRLDYITASPVKSDSSYTDTEYAALLSF